MSWNTEEHIVTFNHHVAAQGDDPRTAGPIIISNSVGYFTGLMRGTSTPPANATFTLFWRPVMNTNYEGRWLPVYLDRASDDGVLPDYALAHDVTIPAATHKPYLFLVNPQTPAAVPLLVDNSTDRLGIELKSIVSNNNPSTSIDYTYNVLILGTEVA